MSYGIGENCRNIGIGAIGIVIPSDESPFLPEKNA